MRVTRVLIYEGDEQWIDTVFQHNKLSEGEPIIAGSNSVTERERAVEWLKEEDGKKNG
jgi:hypothetical protein